MYLVLRPKTIAVKELDTKTEEQNEKLRQEKKYYTEQIEDLQQQRDARSGELNKVEIKLQRLIVQEEELRKRTAQMDEDNELIFQKSFELMQEKMSRAAEQESDKYQQAKEEVEQEYLNTMKELAARHAESIALKKEEIRVVQQELDMLRAKADAAIAAAKREEEKMLELDKYRILVTDLDLLEINRLREIAPYFRNARAIYKIIWESYYRNLTTEMINRVVGAGTHTGIYKLTNQKNQKIYIGQATDIAERFRQHIKCGLGIDAPVNMLYTAMAKDGVENFTFEVLEECERAELNDREKYYIDFYRAQEHGYNMSRGGARN